MNIFIGFATFAEHFIFHQTTQVYEFFKQNNYNLVNNASEADVIFLGGVPFNIFEEIKALLTINYYIRKYPDKKIITIGHLSDMIHGLESFGNLTVIKLFEFHKINDLFEHSIPIEEIQVDTLRYFMPLSIEEIYLVNFGYETNIKSEHEYNESDFKIKVQDLKKETYDISRIKEYDGKYNYLEDISDTLYVETSRGCGSKCAYCTVNKIGYIQSKPANEILEAIKSGLGKGKKTIFLMDQDTGSYGKDIGGIDFSDLLNQIHEIPEDFDVKIYAVDPGKFLKYYHKIQREFFIKRLKLIGFHMQSTSDRLLTMMGRMYNVNEVIHLAKEIKLLNPSTRTYTALIYGFPTETFAEFKDYFQMMRYFDYMEFMLYSEKKELPLSKIKKNSLEEIYKKYLYYQKVHKHYPDKIENTYFSRIQIKDIVRYLY